VLHPRPLAACLAATLALCLAVPALAGQRRVNVSSNFFNDSTLVANAGDQIVWVWTASSHSVTSGTTQLGDGVFNSGIQGGAGRAFAWKTPLASSARIRYVCNPHFSIGMHGRIDFSASSVPVSDFRITEVRFSPGHDSDYVEIANLGDDVGNLGRYRLSLTSASLLTLTPVDMVVPVGGRVVIWLGPSGIGSATQQFFPGLSLPRTGSAALYVATSVASDTLRTRDDLMVDFVQWGVDGQLNEATAAIATYWTAGQFADTPADGHALEFCGSAFERGASFWQGSPVATPGTSNCVTPTTRSSWGRIKAIYR